MATASLRGPLLGLLALALVGLLALAWWMLESGTNTPASPERVTAPVTERPSIDLVAAEVEPDRERVAEAPATTVPTDAARAPDLLIQGRIVTEAGRGIVDIEVSLPYVSSTTAEGTRKNVGSPKNLFAKTHSAADGSFQFALHFPPAGPIARFQVAARSPDWSANEQWVDVPAGSKAVDVGEFVLTRSSTVRGIVRDTSGALVEGASVTAQVANADSSWNSRGESARTSVDGSFVLRDAPSGRVRLGAHEDVRGSSPPEHLTLEPGEDRAGIELVLPMRDDSSAISGLVLDADGTPLAKAPISASFATRNSAGGEGGGGGMSGLRTDAEGRFRIRGAPGAFFRVTAGHPRGESGSVTIDDVPAGTHDIVLRLTPLAMATLRVLSTDGTPVARFAYRVRVQLGTMRTIPTTSKMADRANGECAFPLPDGEFAVEIDAPGFASTEIGPFQSTPNPGVVEARLEPLPALRGFVVRGNEPVVGALVRAQHALERGERWQRDGFRLDARPCEACPTTKTAVDGSFALDIGQPGAWRLRAESAGDVSALSEPIEVSGRRAYGEARIDLALRGSVRGHVRSASGSPLARRRIGVSSGDGNPRSTTSDAAGAYSFEELPPGGYEVRLLADDGGFGKGGTNSSTSDEDVDPIVWTCHVEDGRTTTHDIVVPDPVRLAVRIVVDSALYGSAAFDVWVLRDEPGQPSIRLRATREGDPYVVVLPTAGSWRIEAVVNTALAGLTLGRTADVVPGGSTLEFVIPRGSIRGRLRSSDQAGGTVSLSAATSGGVQVSSTTTARADRTFEFPFAIEGTVDLEPNGEGARRRSVPITRGIVNDVGEL